MKELTVEDLAKLHMRSTVFLDGDGPIKHRQMRECVEHPALTCVWTQTTADKKAKKPGTKIWFVDGEEVEGDFLDDGFIEKILDRLNAYYAKQEEPATP